jgi:hypothetical protein
MEARKEMGIPATALRHTLSPADTPDTFTQAEEQRLEKTYCLDGVRLELVTVEDTDTENETSKAAHTAPEKETMTEELRRLRREKTLREAKPAIADEGTAMERRQNAGLNISMQTFILIGSMIGIIVFLWNNIGGPISSMATDIHDIKSNYVSKETLNTALSNLATKPDFQSLSSTVNQLNTDMATVKNQNNVSITERAALKEAQNKQDAINAAIQERLARMEARQH